MKKTSNKKLTADEIADLADQGKDVSMHFTNKGRMKKPIQRVNVDFTEDMLLELDRISTELNVSRQAVIKLYLRESLDRHYIARSKAV